MLFLFYFLQRISTSSSQNRSANVNVHFSIRFLNLKIKKSKCSSVFHMQALVRNPISFIWPKLYFLHKCKLKNAMRWYNYVMENTFNSNSTETDNTNNKLLFSMIYCIKNSRYHFIWFSCNGNRKLIKEM